MQFDEKRSLTHLMDLLSVEGLSGREGKVAALVKKKVTAAGAKRAWIAFDDAHKRIPGDYEIGNLIIKLPGTVRAPRRLVSGHMDTVPLCRGAVPVRRGGRIVSKGKTGLGGDNRTAVACMVTAIETILTRSLPHPPLTFLFTVGEEVGLFGARYVRRSALGAPKMGFNIDGGDPAELYYGALGADRWELDILGRSAHAGVFPDHGVSATLIAAKAIADVAKRGFFGKIRKGKNKGTANVGVIQGGEATNQVTDHVFIRGESRSHDARFVSTITETYRKAFERAAKSVRNRAGLQGKIRFRNKKDYDPFRIDRSHEVIGRSRAAARAVGLKPKLLLADGGVDANYLNAYGIPTITLGAGQHDPHTIDEYIDVREYLDGCRVVLHAITTLD